MLIRRLLLRRDVTRLACSLRQTRHSSKLAVEPYTAGPTFALRLSAHKPKKPRREPFAKNLVLGKFDGEVLAYPEVQTHDRYREFFEWLEPIEAYVKERIDAREIDESCTIKDEIFEELKKLGVLRAAVDVDYGGLGLNNSEHAKLVEAVSVVPVLGSFMTKRAAVAKLIAEYGTEQQKIDLLPRIADGEIRPTLCFSDSVTGSLSEPLESRAAPSEDETFFTINARKPCVFDATRADRFIVLTRNSAADTYAEIKTLAAFIVPRDAPGLRIERRDSAFGQRGIDVSAITLENVRSPRDTLLGTETAPNDLYVSVLVNGKTNIGAQTIGMLRRFLDLLIKNVTEGKYFNSRRDYQDTIHEVVGNVAASLYAIEAMTYLTAGLMDEYENQDTIVEQSLVECYCTRACREAILQGINLLGARAYLKSEPFEQIIRDTLTLATYDRSIVDMKIFAALVSVQHAGNGMVEKVRQGRNPLFHPLHALRTAFTLDSHEKLYLEENLHPSLRVAARSLEMSVHSLKNCIRTLLLRHGLEVVQQRMELGRLTDIMIEIYAMTATVARASRAYCIGMRNAEEEICAAQIFTYRTHERIKSLACELDDGDWSNGDAMIKNIADKTFNSKEYFASHPLKRNF